jgi:D-alanyl-D-alanine carboxypeptidase (penicillin-binding protein 5/6)
LSLSPPLGVQEAVAISRTGTVAVAGEQAPTPIASVTKMMSALVVLRDHPLSPGESGPYIPITSADVAAYRLEAAQGDSVVKVRAGEQLSELQALEAALIPSGDNVVQLLATWDAGTTTAFVAKMNALARKLGMQHTHYAGPSGVDPATVSTAADQLRLARVAMANPVFASIVSMAQVTLPVAGVQYNVDADLGSDGIDGVKTGWVPQGGGCFVFAARARFHGTDVSVLGVVLGVEGATPVPTALSTAKALVLATEKTLRFFHLPAGSTVATLTAPYGSPIDVLTVSPISLVDWDGAHVRDSMAASSTAELASPTALVGSLTVSAGPEQRASGLRAVGQLHGPSFVWRLTHL